MLTRTPQGPATAVLPFLRFCHQLDFSTSGALCVALNKAAAGSAYKCFKERRVTKAYLALVSPGEFLGCCVETQGSQPTPAGPSNSSSRLGLCAYLELSHILLRDGSVAQ